MSVQFVKDGGSFRVTNSSSDYNTVSGSDCYILKFESPVLDGLARRAYVWAFSGSSFRIIGGSAWNECTTFTHNGTRVYRLLIMSYTVTGATEPIYPEFTQYSAEPDLDALMAEALTGFGGSITGIVLNASELTLEHGETFQFEAEVIGDGDVNPNVTWDLPGYGGTNHSLSGTGFLAIGADDGTILQAVRATSVGNPEIYAICIVTIVAPDSGGGDGGGGETPDPVPDIKPVYLRADGKWAKVTAYERQDGVWVLISTAGG